MKNQMKTYKIIVSGSVQGVGYRFFSLRHANSLKINGYCQNLSNGNVEIYCQGEKNLIESFIEKLKQGPSYSNVQNVKTEEMLTEKTFHSFEILT